MQRHCTDRESRAPRGRGWRESSKGPCRYAPERTEKAGCAAVYLDDVPAGTSRAARGNNRAHTVPQTADGSKHALRGAEKQAPTGLIPAPAGGGAPRAANGIAEERRPPHAGDSNRKSALANTSQQSEAPRSLYRERGVKFCGQQYMSNSGGAAFCT